MLRQQEDGSRLLALFQRLVAVMDLGRTEPSVRREVLSLPSVRKGLIETYNEMEPWQEWYMQWRFTLENPALTPQQIKYIATRIEMLAMEKEQAEQKAKGVMG